MLSTTATGITTKKTTIERVTVEEGIGRDLNGLGTHDGTR